MQAAVWARRLLPVIVSLLIALLYYELIIGGQVAGEVGDDHLEGEPVTAPAIDNPHSQPVAMRVVGSLHDPSIFAGADGLDVAGKFAYVVSGVSNSLSIVDISNPAAPTLTTNLTDDLGRLNRAWGISVSGNYAYVAAGNMGDGDRLTIVDVSDPGHPMITGSVQDHQRRAGPCISSWPGTMHM